MFFQPLEQFEDICLICIRVSRVREILDDGVDGIAMAIQPLLRLLVNPLLEAVRLKLVEIVDLISIFFFDKPFQEVVEAGGDRWIELRLETFEYVYVQTRPLHPVWEIISKTVRVLTQGEQESVFFFHRW